MKLKLAIISAILLFTITLSLAGPEEILPSWNKGEAREKIIKFVDSVTDKNSKNYITPENRVAVFDNDGTLWVEKPFYIQFEYEFYHMKKMAEQDPALREIQPYKASYRDDKTYLYGDEVVEYYEKMINNHKGTTQEDYKKDVDYFLATQTHGKFKRHYMELTYLPMVELVHYLQGKGFKVYIVSGGEVTFVRRISEKIYNIPVENIIGSFVSYEFDVPDCKGERAIIRGNLINIDDGANKPLNIELFTGRRAVFACGNSNGDMEMLRYTADNGGFALLIHHDDDAREYAYDKGIREVLNLAVKEKKITVVSMKRDFKKIFSFE
ncbi:MAG: HAD family hydrolase [Candidatus Eremiobacterota bacterium]